MTHPSCNKYYNDPFSLVILSIQNKEQLPRNTHTYSSLPFCFPPSLSFNPWIWEFKPSILSADLWSNTLDTKQDVKHHITQTHWRAGTRTSQNEEIKEKAVVICVGLSQPHLTAKNFFQKLWDLFLKCSYCYTWSWVEKADVWQALSLDPGCSWW